ncbi:MAG: cupin domain-containing protein [Chloroflexi bacterium]|nr:cupin domain-containing protein [Chloroflexota bacterium]
MNEQTFNYLEDLTTLMADIPVDSIISRTIHDDEHSKSILFGFAPGQALSEHTAAKPAILYFLTGQAQLKLGDDEKPAGPGTWVHMPPHLPHSVVAETEVLMLLVLLEN